MTTSRLYSTEDVADLLGLHVRTIRSYVREGKLRAVRIGKQYRIAHDDIVEFSGGEIEAAGEAATRVEVTSIVNLVGVGDDLLSRLMAVVGGATSSGGAQRERLRVETMYDDERRTAKVIIVGGTDDVARLLTLIGSFAEVG